MLQGRLRTAFRKQLLHWFRQHKRDLPWRQNRDPYRVWISEIMLQQTRVAAVIPYYERFLARFPDVQALAEAPWEEVLRMWSGLGYYSRARNLQRSAQQIVAAHAGNFPDDFEDALELPGIGKYTAAAVLSIAYGAKHAVLDGNVARVLARLGAIRGDLRDAKRWQSLQDSADELLALESPGDWNQAMMELGALVCTPRSPQCAACPVAKFCRAHKLGLAESLPSSRKKPTRVDIQLAAAVFVNAKNQTLLLPPPHRNGSSATHENVVALVSRMWHFPIIATEENPALELRAFLKRLSGQKAELPRLQFAPLAKIKHTVTFRNVTIHAFRILVQELPSIPGMRRVVLAELCAPSSLAVSNLIRKVARAAQEAFPETQIERDTSAVLRFRAASAR
jgi:A/G-specific adenine glycosylase